MKQITEDIIVRCRTLNEAEIVCKFLHSVGYIWNGDGSLLGHTNWEENKNNTCYTINHDQVLYGNLKCIEAEIYKKITVKESMNMNGVGKRSLRL